ncbi:MAG: hypothetical protein ABI862_18300 [Ilumatobacteraceae bacterium]
MGLYLTIPEVVESEEFVSLSADADRVTFRLVLELTQTATHLIRACEIGQNIPLVVLTTDAQILALDSVYVADFSTNDQQPYVQVTLQAQEVRFV